jgi:hypothetical protein
METVFVTIETLDEKVEVDERKKVAGVLNAKRNGTSLSEAAMMRGKTYRKVSSVTKSLKLEG